MWQMFLSEWMNYGGLRLAESEEAGVLLEETGNDGLAQE